HRHRHPHRRDQGRQATRPGRRRDRGGFRASPGMEGNHEQGQGHFPRGGDGAARRPGWGGGAVILMIDNYDSFTYNVVQYLGELGADVRVYRNDELTLDQIETLAPEKIVISPGPCTPSEAGISVAALQHFAGRTPLLGIR